MSFAFQLRYLHWWLLLTIAALGAVVFALRRLERMRRKRLDCFVEAKLAPRLLVGCDAASRRPLGWLTLLGFACLAVTFAQPHWGKAWEEVRQQSRDIIVCLDTSESMNAENPQPSRLERAKQKIVSLMDRAGGDRYALVAFTGGAALQCPLTLDHGYFKAVLNAVDTDTISLEGTNIAAALREASNELQEEEKTSGASDKNNRAILLISDGEQVSGDAVKEAEAAAEIARVFIIGVGDPQGAEVRMPEWMARYGTAVDRQPTHLSKLDEETLKRVAAAGSGAYVRSSVDNWDIDQIWDRLQALSSRDVGSTVRSRLVNRYQWPLALAILCFAAEGAWLVLMPWMRTSRVSEQTHA